MRLIGFDSSIELRIDGYKSDQTYGDPDSPDWLGLHVTLKSRNHVRTGSGVSLDTDEVRELAIWIREIGEVRSGPDCPQGPFRSLLAFSEPDIAVRVMAIDSACATIRWYVRDPTANENYSDVLPSFSSARAFSITISLWQLKIAARELADELSNFPNR